MDFNLDFRKLQINISLKLETLHILHLKMYFLVNKQWVSIIISLIKTMCIALAGCCVQYLKII